MTIDKSGSRLLVVSFLPAGWINSTVIVLLENRRDGNCVKSLRMRTRSRIPIERILLLFILDPKRFVSRYWRNVLDDLSLRREKRLNWHCDPETKGFFVPVNTSNQAVLILFFPDRVLFPCASSLWNEFQIRRPGLTAFVVRATSH